MESLYHKRHLLYFMGILPAVISPIVFPFMWIGVWRSFKSKIAHLPLVEKIRLNLFGPDHLQRVQWLIALIPLMIMAGHSYLAWRGKMASKGKGDHRSPPDPA